jgi:hypothetical protein
MSSKAKLLKKILLESTKGMKKLIKEQEEIIAGDIHNDETKIGCNYTIGYATGIHAYRKEWLKLLSMSKKEIKEYIKHNNKIKAENKKYLDNIFKDILDNVESKQGRSKSTAIGEIVSKLDESEELDSFLKTRHLVTEPRIIPITEDAMKFDADKHARFTFAIQRASEILLNYKESHNKLSNDDIIDIINVLIPYQVKEEYIENITKFYNALTKEQKLIYIHGFLGRYENSDTISEPIKTLFVLFSDEISNLKENE